MMVDPERTYGRFGYERTAAPKPVVEVWVHRTVKCSRCDAVIDRQTTKLGNERIVGALLTDDAMRDHAEKTGCWGGIAVSGDWEEKPACLA